jgi:hypothetical protein
MTPLEILLKCFLIPSCLRDKSLPMRLEIASNPSNKIKVIKTPDIKATI